MSTRTQQEVQQERDKRAARAGLREAVTVKCAYCGKRHCRRPAYVGYGDAAMCAKCERDLKPRCEG